MLECDNSYLSELLQVRINSCTICSGRSYFWILLIIRFWCLLLLCVWEELLFCMNALLMCMKWYVWTNVHFTRQFCKPLAWYIDRVKVLAKVIRSILSFIWQWNQFCMCAYQVWWKSDPWIRSFRSLLHRSMWADPRCWF